MIYIYAIKIKSCVQIGSLHIILQALVRIKQLENHSTLDGVQKSF